jgi:hypothetical protein
LWKDEDDEERGWSLADENQKCGPCCDNSSDFVMQLVPDPPMDMLREWVKRYGGVNEALHDVAMHALDLTLSCQTTVGVPEEIRRRAHATHRRLLAYRDKFTLRSRGEVEKGQRDTSIDNPNVNAFGAPVETSVGERIAKNFGDNKRCLTDAEQRYLASMIDATTDQTRPCPTCYGTGDHPSKGDGIHTYCDRCVGTGRVQNG